jgi:hypothetical protein
LIASLGFILLAWAGRVLAQVPQADPNPIVVDQAAVRDNRVVLMAAASEHNPALSLIYSGPSYYPKHYWFNNWTNSATDYMKWSLSVPTGAVYHVYAKLSASTEVPLSLKVEGAGTELIFTTRNFGWDHLDAGTIFLPSGTNQVVLRRLTSSPISVSIMSLELIRESDRAAYEQRVADFRSDTTWLSRSKYGLMFECGAWGYTPSGPRQSLEEFANGFDVPRFVNLVTNTGAQYVIWSLTWYTYQMCAPIQAVDNILGNSDRTSSRDLIGELATALHRENVRFMLYYHTGQDRHLVYNSTDWWRAQQFPAAEHTDRGTGDRHVFFDNWVSVVSEIGDRYGTNLDGWFFDDALVYYPAPFERLGAAAKLGNPDRLVSYNPWIAVRYTDFQDVWMGEDSHGERQVGSGTFGGNGIFSEGPQQGLLQHAMFTMEQDWGIYRSHQPIVTQVDSDRAIAWVRSASERGVPLTFNMMMWNDQTFSTDSLAVLLRLRDAVVGAATNLVVNGDFEAPVTAPPSVVLAPGAASLPGWWVNASPAGGVELGAPGDFGNDGSQALLLASGTATSQGGGISQLLPTEPGRTYLISVDLAAPGVDVATAELSFGGSRAMLDARLPTFTTFRWQAVATNNLTPLTIATAPSSRTRPLIVDNLSVTAVTAPTILIQPGPRKGYAGNSALFRATTDGTGPLSYQWFFNASTPLAGATNATLVLNKLQLDQAGDYSFVVSNQQGWVASVLARLTVEENATVNGDFEDPRQATWDSYPPGDPSIVGWSVVAAPPDGVQLAASGVFPPSDDTQVIQLTGGQGYGSGGGLSQMLTTTPGREYLLSVDFASRSGSDTTGHLTFGTNTYLLATGVKYFSNQTWLVVATAARTPIEITGDTNSSRSQIIIDNVLAVPTRPEIKVRRAGNQVVLSWPSGTIQEADDVKGPFRNLPGLTSPWTIAETVAREKFYRIIR